MFFRKNTAYTVPEFANANKHLLIIVCDPTDDSIAVCYKNKFARGTIKSATGKTQHVVRDVLKNSRFKSTIDEFLVSIADSLGINLKIGNQFLNFIDGALFKISKALSEKESK